MSSTLKQAIQALKVRVADAFAAVEAKGGTLPATQDTANLPAAIASIPSGGSIEGYYKANDVPYDDFTQFISEYKNTLAKIDDDKVISLSRQQYLFYNSSLLASVNYPNLEIIWICDEMFTECRQMETCDLPKVNYIYRCGWREARNLRRLNLIAIATRFESISMTNAYNLIDFIIGRDATINLGLSFWNPTNALDANSSSLVEAGETFANNREKLLYNIREHIAKILNTNAGNRTITFSANIKAAILADAETLAAFPANWTIA